MVQSRLQLELIWMSALQAEALPGATISDPCMLLQVILGDILGLRNKQKFPEKKSAQIFKSYNSYNK